MCMSAVTEGSSTRSEVLGTMGAALVGIVAGTAVAPLASNAASVANANRELSS